MLRKGRNQSTNTTPQQLRTNVSAGANNYGRARGFQWGEGWDTAALLEPQERCSPSSSGNTHLQLRPNPQRGEVFAVVAELEGHPDNAGAWYGGLIAASADRVAQLPIVHDWVLLVWIPDSTTSTDKSRTQLDAVVPRVDAVANLGNRTLCFRRLHR